MASYWEMQAELRQQELLESARGRRQPGITTRRRRARILRLALPQLRGITKR